MGLLESKWAAPDSPNDKKEESKPLITSTPSVTLSKTFNKSPHSPNPTNIEVAEPNPFAPRNELNGKNKPRRTKKKMQFISAEKKEFRGRTMHQPAELAKAVSKETAEESKNFNIPSLNGTGLTTQAFLILLLNLQGKEVTQDEWAHVVEEAKATALIAQVTQEEEEEY